MSSELPRRPSRRGTGDALLRLENVHIFRLGPTWETFHGDVEIRGQTIERLGPSLPPPPDHCERVDLDGAWVLPGFVQGHVHLCQTLFRGLAEGLPLDRWLAERIWPLEAAHTAQSVGASARIAVAELLSSGTTSVLDMGSVRHTERIGQVFEETGYSGIIGKAIMDAGEGVPEALLEKTDHAIGSALELAQAWDGRAERRIGACLAPRFVLSVSRKAWRRIREIHEGRAYRIHTHACETSWENRTSRRVLGRTPIAFFESQGLLDPGVTLAHVVRIGRREEEWLAATGTRAVHCPSSNQKLGAGIAPVARLRKTGVTVGLGCDGAACNNGLDAFEEMRRAILAASLASGPGSLTARDALDMATAGGAAALGWETRVGRLEKGLRADLLVLWPWGHPNDHADPHETVVQEGNPGRVKRVYLAGRLMYREGTFLTLNIGDIVAEADEERGALLRRLGWSRSSLPLRSPWDGPKH